MNTLLRIPESFRVGDLIIDETYQTLERWDNADSQRRINAMADNWDYERAGTIMVSERDGKLYVLDGNHRRLALIKALGPDAQIMGYRKTGLTLDDEVTMFLRENEGKKTMSAAVKFLAQANAGRTLYSEIKDALAKYGFSVSVNKKNRNAVSVADSANTKWYKLDSVEPVEFAASVVRGAFGENVPAIMRARYIWEALVRTHVDNSHTVIDRAKMAEVVREFYDFNRHVDALNEEKTGGNQHKNGLVYQRELAKMYNRTEGPNSKRRLTVPSI